MILKVIRNCLHLTPQSTNMINFPLRHGAETKNRSTLTTPKRDGGHKK